MVHRIPILVIVNPMRGVRNDCSMSWASLLAGDGLARCAIQIIRGFPWRAVIAAEGRFPRGRRPWSRGRLWPGRWPPGCSFPEPSAIQTRTAGTRVAKFFSIRCLKRKYPIMIERKRAKGRYVWKRGLRSPGQMRAVDSASGRIEIELSCSADPCRRNKDTQASAVPFASQGNAFPRKQETVFPTLNSCTLAAGDCKCPGCD